MNLVSMDTVSTVSSDSTMTDFSGNTTTMASHRLNEVTDVAALQSKHMNNHTIHSICNDITCKDNTLIPFDCNHRRKSHKKSKSKESAIAKRRNERERRRVQLVNDGFSELRKHVPTDPENRKLSKVKILRSAIEYITQLQELLKKQTAPEVPRRTVYAPVCQIPTA